MRIIRGTLWVLALAALVALAAPQAYALCCNPDQVGQVADVNYSASSVDWRVFAENTAVHLTVSTPCGIIERTYDKGENPFFSIEELAPDNPDGSYTWQVRIEPVVSAEVKEALLASRITGDEEIVKTLCRKGMLPQGPFVQTGEFTVVKGSIVDPFAEEPRSKLQVLGSQNEAAASLGVIDGEEGLNKVTAKTVISGDLTVYNSLCVGFDCLSSESYGADTIRLKENNLRIHADDTSTISGFPNTDWRLEFNSQNSGGGSYFRVIDASASRNIMTLEANAPSNSLYVDDGGRVGLGTSTPSVELHVVDGDTPTLRLAQDGSSGFAPQTWDVAGNETSFFIRDTTSGSTLPFRIRPGAASNKLVITTDGVGVGTLSPDTLFTVQSGASNADVVNVRRSGSTDKLFRVFEASTGEGVFSIYNNTNGENIRLTGQGQGRVAIGCASGLAADLTLNSAGGGACGSGTESTINAGSTTFTITSSRTIKENLEPVKVDDILDKIAGIDVYTYDFIDGPKDALGLMAEDFHQVFGRGSDKRLNGQEVEMALWLAVQKLTAEKDALSGRVQHLEGLLDTLLAK